MELVLKKLAGVEMIWIEFMHKNHYNKLKTFIIIIIIRYYYYYYYYYYLYYYYYYFTDIILLSQFVSVLNPVRLMN